MNENLIIERWREVLGARRKSPAILAPDGAVLRTFEEIEAESALYERRFQNFSQGGAVAIQTGNVPEWPALLLAAWRSGLAVIPMERDLPLIIRSALEKACGTVCRIETIGGELGFVTLEGTPRGGELPDLIKLTSGTTSEPRGVAFTAGQLLEDCDNICTTMGIGDGDLNYGVISMAHSYGFSNLITPLLCRGIPLVAAMDMMSRAVAAGLRATGATVLPGVPVLFRHLLESGAVPSTLRLCISAGAPLPLELSREFFRALGRKIHSFYGASECGGICYDDSGIPPDCAGFVGRPMSGVRVEPADDCGDGAFRFRVRSGAVGTGYHPAEAGDEPFFNGIFQPRDLLEPLAGAFRIAGRDSDFINVAGKKVNPAVIETALLSIDGVREAVVFGVPSGTRGEKICAWVAGDRLDEQHLRRSCATLLPAWQAPREIRIVERIPVNSRGKISRRELAILSGG